MKLFLILLLLFCSTIVGNPLIKWEDVVGKSWTTSEKLSSNQVCYLKFTFERDSIFLIKTFKNPSGRVTEMRYMKGAVYQRQYAKDNNGDTDLFFVWKRKHYADITWQCPVEGFDYTDSWFLWRIDNDGNLLMGQGVPNTTCYYWTLNRKY